MSTDESEQSIKAVSDNIETSSATVTTVGLEEKDDKADESTMKLDITTTETSTGSSRMTIPESASDFHQWLQSMLAVARLPGGLPIEFRRKLWLALAERYLKRRKVDWEIEKAKWLSDNWRADDEELGIQIVKDLHRTGHSLLSGASGQLYQAKLKKILLGYTRWNPEVGYCQGFNMLGAIILQVMDKDEVDSIKVMIFLIEGLLPKGYFCGGLMGLQADMAVFRELLGYKLPKLARHLQKLQNSTNEPSFEPPIINVFTMQWFLTLFCNCLPMSYVLRIWDLIMIEGSDILLRTALSIWKLMEDRILREVRTADDFYCKMGTLSAELLNGTLMDSNRLIHMISTLGPINDLHQLRQKHLAASYNDQKQLKMLYTSAESDESRMAVANAWATRRGSQPRLQSDREKIALDISILKKQYDKLRERQKQAHVILSSAVSKQHRQKSSPGPSQVNKLLVGKNAIVSKGRKGPPKGSIPPVRNQKLVKSSKPPSIQVRNDETIHWNSTDEAKKRRNSMSWKDLNAEKRAEELKTVSKSSSASSLGGNKTDMASPKRGSDSSSYSEDSDCESSPSTSLCDDDITSSLEASPMKKKRHKDFLPLDVTKKTSNMKTIEEISPVAPEIKVCPEIALICPDGETKPLSPITNFYLDLNSSNDITSTSQLSPMPDISSYFTAISPIQTPCDFFEFPDFSSFILNTGERFQESERFQETESFRVSDDGVTNEFFERVFEENNAAFPVSPENNVAMTKSYSPSILPTSEIKDSPKYIKQKSLSMDEQTQEKEEVIAINRSFSDGTIMNVDVKCDGFQKIIAENSKILNKLITRPNEPSQSQPNENNYAKLNIEPAIMEETKSPGNSSDAEDEIAAIDKVDEADDIKEGIMLSDIQDLANIESYLQERNESTDASFNNCNTYTDENVTERNEKSIPDENETLATLACSPLENKTNSDAEGEGLSVKALTLNSERPKVEARRVEEKSESPKFNEIQLMVTKLKEEMESQLKSCGPEIDEEKVIETIIDEKKIEPKIDEKPIAKEDKSEEKCLKDEKVTVDNADKVIKLPEVSITVTSTESDSKPNESIVNDKPKAEASVKAIGLEGETLQSSGKESIACDDLEKVASDSMQKIDKSDSDVILEKLNTQLEHCQKPLAKEILTESHKNIKVDDSKVDEKAAEAVKNDIESKDNSVKDESRNKSVDEVKVEPKKVEPKKDSKEILDKLNMELERLEKSRRSGEPKGRSTYETSAVMELATLIKERELEKLSEAKQLMKTQKDVEFDLSPAREPRSRSSPRISSPEAKKPNYFYDHEPRNETRRRDVNTLETEQRMRRPFKSSPSSSLSSSPSNISNTLSSIQNTIKILDSACQKTDLVNNKSNYDKAMESVEKICDTDRDWRSYKNKTTRYESPTFKIDEIGSDQPKRRTFIDDERIVDKTFDLSPRSPRKPLYDFDPVEFIFKSSRDVSPVRTPSRSPSRFTAKTPDIDPNYVAKLRYLSTEEYIAGRKSPLGGSRENLSVKFRIDRSPTSPVLSSHFSRSPRSPSHSSTLLRFPPSDARSSKSAENSPSRYSGERVESNYKYNSASGTIDSKADSMSNLSYKPNKKYDYDWETPSCKKKYDFY